jgi:hypothetical protein
LFKQVLPSGKYSDRRMNNLLSEGYQAAERFLIFQKLSEDHKLQKDLLSQEFQSRHLEDWFFRDIQKEIIRLEEKEVKDWEDHLDLLRLNRRMYHHPNQNPRMQAGGETIVKMGEQLDLVYLLEKAAIIKEKIARNRIIKDENYEIETELEKWRSACKDIQHPALDFYKMRFAYTEEDRIKQYFILRDAFLSGYEKLNLKEQKIHLIGLLNDASLMFRMGHLEIIETLPLYKLGLKTGILLHKGKLTYNTFTIIVTVSNTKKDFAFTKQFIADYKDKLDGKFQEEAITWAKAHMAYYKEDYNTALDLLLTSENKSNYFQLLSRSLTTQVYFDLYLSDNSYQEYLLNYFDSFERWLSREKFKSEFTKKGFIKFVQKCRALEKHYSNLNFQSEKVKDLLSEENIQGLTWLKEKQNIILKLRSS